MNQERRDFLKTCGCLSLVGIAAFSGISCSTNSPGPTAPEVSSCPFTIDDQGNLVMDLADCGSLNGNNSAIAVPNTPRGTLILTHTTGENYYALSNVCTHQRCAVSATTPHLYCPCHGSQYDLQGRVVHGPASSPLTSYQVSVQGTVITVSFG